MAKRDLDQVCEQCEKTAITIVRHVSAKDWPDWALYILEILGTMHDLGKVGDIAYGPGDVDYEWVLSRLRQGIQKRLATGQW